MGSAAAIISSIIGLASGAIDAKNKRQAEEELARIKAQNAALAESYSKIITYGGIAVGVMFILILAMPSDKNKE